MTGTCMADRPRYLGRSAIAGRRGISPDLLAHRMRRHPAGIPEPDAYEELGNGELAPLWRPGRMARLGGDVPRPDRQAPETSRVHLNDLGNPDAVPVPRDQYERIRVAATA